MKKTFFLVAFLFLIAGLTSGCGSKNQVINNTKTDNPESFVGSLNDLLNRGEAMKCTYSKNDDQGKYDGVFYIDGGNQRVRSEIEMTLTSTTTKIMAYGIMDKEYSYSWTSLLPNKGYKIKLADAKATSPAAKPDSGQKVNWQEKNNFSCSHWNLDESFFALPTGVDFQDMNSILPKISTSTTSTTKNMSICGLCAQIPDANAKAQCLKSCQ